MAAGIAVRHQRSCPARQAGRCRCKPGYQATVYSARDQKRIRRTFPTLAAARQWRAEAILAVRRGELTASRSPTLRDAVADWLEGARAGTVRNRSGDVYKPAAVRT